MARTVYYINPSLGDNSNDGLSELTPKAGYAGITWAPADYRNCRGTTLYETITVGAAGVGARIYDYGTGALPIIDCAGVRASGVSIDSRARVEVFNLDLRNQNAAAPDGAVRITGSAGGYCHVHDCVFWNNRISVHINVSPYNRIEQNTIYCGNASYKTSAHGVRVNGASSVGNRIGLNRIFGSAAHDHVDCILANNAPKTVAWSNDITGTKADAIAFFSGSDGSAAIGNVVHGALLKDGIAVEDSDGVSVLNNTVVHPGDLSGHDGPCLKIGDNFGAGTAPTNCTVKNNILHATNRLPMALDPIGAGTTFSNNCYFKTDGNVIANLDKSGTLTPLTYASWLLEGLDTDSMNDDPLLDREYRLKTGSPCIGAGIYIKGARHFGGKRLGSPADIGAHRHFTRSTTSSRRTTLTRAW